MGSPTDDEGDGLAAAALPLLWAKLCPGGYHPLLCHLVDVAAVAEALWDRAVIPATRALAAADLGLPESDARRWFALWAALHDTGKASPCFARRDPTAKARLPAVIPLNENMAPYDEPHGAISAVALRSGLSTELELNHLVARRVAAAVGGHHGTFPGPDERRAAALAGGGPIWEAIRRELIRRLAAVLGLGADTPRPGALPEGAAIWLAGFVSVADWLGSNQAVFPPLAVDGVEPAVEPAAYLALARARAARTLDLLVWTVPVSTAPPRAFTDLFPNRPPNPMQRVVIDLGERLAGPSLVVVESETGSGKSEAAFWLADRWATREGRVGAYVALPTRATSDQMFGRVRDFLQRRHPDDPVNLQLLHGLAGLSSEFGELRRLTDRRLVANSTSANLFAPDGIWGPPGDDGAPATVVAAEWFTHRKRGLLAPFGVGTIDQALLAVLQTRHYFVRLSGLAGKTVVLDEVHAYDAYMSTILEQLLRWLAALGSSVVLLSATLPATRRDALVAAYREGLDPPRPSADRRPSPPALAGVDRDVPYPRVSWVSRGGTGVLPIPRAPGVRPRQVTVEWVDGEPPLGPDDPFPLGDRLRMVLAGGGCAAVVCNTVDRVQRVYAALKRTFPGEAVFVDGPGDGGPEVDLLHARFRFRDRQEREQRVLARFGKEEEQFIAPDGSRRPVRRPSRAIVVATQVNEQSLDLDFDLLVTDLAPIDLILQRMGRLHRHPRPSRPAGLDAPRLWLCQAMEEDGVPAFDRGSAFVYDRHVLLRSWLAMRRVAPDDHGTIVVPDHVQALVEEVYGDRVACPAGASPALRACWDETWERLQQTLTEQKRKAQQLLVLAPGAGDEIFEDKNRRLVEDDPSFHPDLQALTRLAPPTVDAVCLTPDERARLLPAGRPTDGQALELLRHAVAIGNRHVYHDLVNLPVRPGWKRSALLRHHRLLELDGAGGCVVGNHRIVRNEELGITIEAAG